MEARKLHRLVGRQAGRPRVGDATGKPAALCTELPRPAGMLAPFIIITNALQAHGPTLRTLKDQRNVEAGGWQRLGRGRRGGRRRRGHPAAHGHAELKLRGRHWVAHPVEQLGDGDPVGALADAVVCRGG